MEVKGTAVKTIPMFITKKYPDKYDDWYQSLSKESQDFIKEGLITNKWYPVKETAMGLTKALADTVFNGDERQAGFECGRFSADEALTGIYKIYVRASSPNHIIDRANRAFTAYYSPSEMKVVDKSDKSVTVHVTQEESYPIVEFRIAGWMQRALEISGCKNVSVDITKSRTSGDDVTEFVMRWD